jgi:hypothetical protein
MKTKEQCEKALSGRVSKLEKLQEEIASLSAWKESTRVMHEPKLYVQLSADIQTKSYDIGLLQAEISLLQTILEN